jgi:hypothetical protein
MPSWVYPHVDFGEPALPNGASICRPAVPVSGISIHQTIFGVIDSGSPISVADSHLFERLGVDIATAQPVFEVPLTLGGRFGTIPIFAVELLLQPPSELPNETPIRWRVQLGSRPNWSFPFAILFGQQGWFDFFPTMIDATSTEVHFA